LFLQCFGNRDALDDLNEADLLTAVRFDETGDFLATGDKGGRIVIFKRGDAGSNKRRRAAVVDDTSTSEVVDDGPSGFGVRSADYKFYTEFQSHESEFDYLKSLEIEEKINQITWCKRANSALFMLSTNDKTIKLWKVHEKAAKAVANINVETGRYGAVMPVSALRVPTVSSGETSVIATPRRVYANAHAYHINSLSVNSDGQTFLSADDLRVNVWNLDNPKLSYNVVDIKPPSLEELTEVITAADFHPFHCHMFMYASSRGTIKIADMRASALCDRHAKCT
jgi:serine/threonine-protein phosphatase 2A regulatory subunit B